MTAAEMMKEQIEDAGFQLSKAFEGLTEEQMDYRATPVGMTPREMLAHLSEAYQALITHVEGGKHQWGSYSPADRSTQALTITMWDLRKRSTDAALSQGDADALRQAYNYIVAHDNYHVGQVCEARLMTDPAWNAYSIYSHSA